MNFLRAEKLYALAKAILGNRRPCYLFECGGGINSGGSSAICGSNNVAAGKSLGDLAIVESALQMDAMHAVKHGGGTRRCYNRCDDDNGNGNGSSNICHTNVDANAGLDPDHGKETRILAAFDFDSTIVSRDTDIVVREMLPKEKITDELQALLKKAGWNAYMAAIFRLLHQCHVSSVQISQTIRCIPEVPGSVRLLRRLRRCENVELIIISDANRFFICEWLHAHGLQSCFSSIFTNPAHSEGNGLLKTVPYTHQTSCRLCPPNMCKGAVLDEFVARNYEREHFRYKRIVYVGDGDNDMCPVLRLQTNDIACVRSGFMLEKKLEQKKNDVNAKIILWNDGFDLLSQLEKELDLEEELEMDSPLTNRYK